MEMQCLIINKLKNKESVMIIIAISNQPNNVSMMNTAQNLHLCLKLPLPLITSVLELLYRNHTTTADNAFVHKAKTPFSEEVMVGKSVISISMDISRISCLLVLVLAALRLRLFLSRKFVKIWLRLFLSSTTAKQVSFVLR
jgi:hypothetical protein